MTSGGVSWGLQNRLARLIKPQTKRTVMLAVDHGYFLGPIKGLENPKRTITPLLPYADALMLTRGVLRTSVDPTADVAIVLRVSGGNTIAGPVLGNEDIVTSIRDAIRLNAAALAFSIYVGTPYEHQTLKALAKLVDLGEDYGIPILAVTAVGRELEKRETKYIALACRVAAELGAHFIKTYYTPEFEKVVDALISKDQTRAVMYANEVAELRKVAKSLFLVQVALEQIGLRIESIREIGEVAAYLGPVVGVVKDVREAIKNTLPEIGIELGEIQDILQETVMEAGEMIGVGGVGIYSTPDARKILEEAKVVAEQRMKESFPALPSIPALTPEQAKSTTESG